MAGVIHKVSIIAQRYCLIVDTFSTENDDQRLARRLSQFANFELLVPGVATTTMQSYRAATTGGDVTAFSSTLSSKFISTSVILPSVSGHSRRTARRPADLRGTRAVVDIDTCHAS